MKQIALGLLVLGLFAAEIPEALSCARKAFTGPDARGRAARRSCTGPPPRSCGPSRIATTAPACASAVAAAAALWTCSLRATILS
jgi:hypothetical protein